MNLTDELARTAARADRLRADASRDLRNAAARATRQGMSQRTIAAAMNRSQPEISRLLARSEARDANGDHRRWMTARSASDAMSAALARGDETTAFKMLIQALDHLRSLRDPRDIAEWGVEPAPIKDPRFDTLLRALTKRTLVQLDLDVPEWAESATRLEHEWLIPRAPSRRARAKRESPPELAALNVFVTENDLATL